MSCCPPWVLPQTFYTKGMPGSVDVQYLCTDTLAEDYARAAAKWGLRSKELAFHTHSDTHLDWRGAPVQWPAPRAQAGDGLSSAVRQNR